MPQHDYAIADASGTAFLADLNNALAAIVSNNSGAAAPSTTYAYQLWADTGSTPPTLRQRNAANNAWIPIGELGVGNLGSLSPASSGTRNVLINANPIINQRGYVSGTATTAANQYTLDRWRVVTSGQSVPWSDSGNVRTVTAPASGIEQVIEGSSLVSGTYTLNWTGTAAATVAGVAVTKGSQVTLTGGVDTAVRFSGGAFSLPQLERGSAATQFELRSEGHELAACQRYYYQPDSTFFYQQYASTASQNIPAPFFFPVTMRAVPTLSGNSGWGNGFNATAGTINLFTYGLYANLSSAGAGIFQGTFSVGSVSAEL
jgi:hypothetical protein